MASSRLRISPSAPSLLWAAIRTTVRAKFGSTSVGEAISSFPWSDSMMTQRRPEIVLPA